MRDDPQDLLLEYYLRELDYLRQSGAEFARRHPRLAERLEIGALEESPDPHVERLLEGVAFLTGRIQYNLDREFPQIPSALLEILYPQLAAPVPSVSTACFPVDGKKVKQSTGFTLPRHTLLNARGRRDEICYLRTAADLTLWPIEVVWAGFRPAADFPAMARFPQVTSVLQLRLRALEKNSFDALEVDRLRLHLSGDVANAARLHELLTLGDTPGLAMAAEGDQRARREVGVEAVGFADDEALLPGPRHGHPGYRLLQEYFTFPQKFLYVDVVGLSRIDSGQTLDLLLPLARRPDARTSVDADTVKLGCVPVINLFPKTTDPIRISPQQLEYRLSPDKRYERVTEIHTIEKVCTASGKEAGVRELTPFFSFDHAQPGSQRAFWYARRAPATQADLPGTEMLLSFLDLDFDPEDPTEPSAYAYTLCTNRDLAAKLPAGARLFIEQDVPVADGGLHLLQRPTPQAPATLAGQALWRLVSHLSLNYLSLGGPEGLTAFKEVLRLYAGHQHAGTQAQIDGLTAMTTEETMRPIGFDAWRGFVRGTRITLTLDEAAFQRVGASAYLFASVLERFFGLYASANSFTELVIKRAATDREWTRWPPRAGDRALV